MATSRITPLSAATSGSRGPGRSVPRPRSAAGTVVPNRPAAGTVVPHRPAAGTVVPHRPASLTRTGGRRDRSCAGCGSTRLTELSMTLTDGSPVGFVSCHDCEHRSWSEAGAPLSVHTVLWKARKPR